MCFHLFILSVCTYNGPGENNNAIGVTEINIKGFYVALL